MIQSAPSEAEASAGDRALVAESRPSCFPGIIEITQNLPAAVSAASSGLNDVRRRQRLIARRADQPASQTAFRPPDHADLYDKAKTGQSGRQRVHFIPQMTSASGDCVPEHGRKPEKPCSSTSKAAKRCPYLDRPPPSPELVATHRMVHRFTA